MKMNQMLEGSIRPWNRLTQSSRCLVVCADTSRVKKVANRDYNEVKAETGEKGLRNLVDHAGICREVHHAG